MKRAKEVKKEKKADSSSFSSSSDSDKDSRPGKKKKKSDKHKTRPLLSSLRKRIASCFDSDKKECGSYFSPTCFAVYFLLGLASIAFLYYYGLFIWSLINPYFKSTNTIVNEALAKFNADKIGLADYALESAGGSILCSSNTYYSRSGALYSMFGVPLWYHSSSPREVIQPDVQPGKCWAMDGNKGYVMIQLSMPVVVTAITLEHIPAQVAPTGRLDSAPKDFLIVGKETNMESPDINLGTFLYKADVGTPIQTFHIRDPYCTRQTTNYAECSPNKQVFRIIDLRVLSNHGNKDYTCLYRVRVHGKPLAAVPGQNDDKEQSVLP